MIFIINYTAYAYKLYNTLIYQMGSDQSKPEKPKNKPQKQPKQQAAPAMSTDQKRIKIQAAINNLDSQIAGFEDQQKKKEKQIQLYKEKARQYMEEGKNKEARKFVEQAAKIQKQAQSITLRKKALNDKKFQLQQTSMDMLTVDAIEGAQQHLKEQEKYSEKMDDLIIDGKEAKMHADQINEKLKDLADVDEENQQADEMLRQIQRQMQRDKKKKIEGTKNVSVHQAEKQKLTDKQQRDEIQAMINEM